MRHLARVLVAVTSLMTALATCWMTAPLGRRTAAAAGSAAADSAFVQQVSFNTAIAAFVAIAKARIGPNGAPGDTWFDWTTDFCSAPLIGNTGRSFNFTDACRRHDFGYRNTKLLDRRYGAGRYWTGDARKRIDQQFLADMKASCMARSVLNVPPCLSWAYTYYGAVRSAGGP